jgi:hypothetical protein
MEKHLLNVRQMRCYSIQLTWGTKGLVDLTTSILLYLDGDILHNSYIELITKILTVVYIIKGTKCSQSQLYVLCAMRCNS